MKAGLTMSAEKHARGTPLEGITVVLSGRLPTLTRDVAKEMIESAGGRVSGTVSGISAQPPLFPPRPLHRRE